MSSKDRESEKPRLIHLSLPLPLTPETVNMRGSSSEDTGVPPHKKQSLFITITLILSGFFVSAGVLMFSSVGGLVVGFLSSFFTSMTGWDAIIVALFLGAVFWFIAAVLYVKHKGADNIAKQVEQSLFSQYYQYQDVDLGAVSVQQLAREMQNKGCVIKESGMNTQIYCSERMLIDKINENYQKMTFTRKFIAVTVSIVIMIVIVVAYLYGLLAFLGLFDWVGIIVGFGLVAFILLNAEVIKLIHAIFLLIIPMVVMFIIGMIDPSFIWVVLGVCMALIIIVGVIYYLKEHLCKQDSWVCDFL